MKDVSTNGKERPWKDKKLSSLFIADSFSRNGLENKAFRVSTCANILRFKEKIDGSMKLHQAFFCKVRLCPMCSWRRQLKIFGQLSQVVKIAKSEHQLQFLFLTLTMKNCQPEALPAHIDILMNGFRKMSRSSRFKKSIQGTFRALEVTRNEVTGEYHPHLHIILAVKKSYFDRHQQFYINNLEWKQIWKDSIHVDYDPMINIHLIRGNSKNLEKAVAEAGKYTLKESDLILEDVNEMDSNISILDEALFNRRLVSYTGILKTIHQQLGLDDSIDGDLVNTDNDDSLDSELSQVIHTYCWAVGYSNYLHHHAEGVH